MLEQPGDDALGMHVLQQATGKAGKCLVHGLCMDFAQFLESVELRYALFRSFAGERLFHRVYFVG